VVLWTLDIPVRFCTAYTDNETGYMVRRFWPHRIHTDEPTKEVHVEPKEAPAGEALAEEAPAEEQPYPNHFVKGIALRYITRLFVVDLLAVAPCIYAFFVAGTPHELPAFFQAGGSRIVKLVRLADTKFVQRAMRDFVHKSLQRLEDIYGWDNYDYIFSNAFYNINAAVSLVQHVVMFGMVLHVRGHCLLLAALLCRWLP
jgi:hypothetical protein